MDGSPIVVGVLAGLAILAGHWFPWRKLLGRDLHRTEAYIYGVTAICAPVLAAYALAGEAWAGFVLGASVFGAGVATLASKAVDASIEREHRLRDLEDKLAYGRAEGLPEDTEG